MSEMARWRGSRSGSRKQGRIKSYSDLYWRWATAAVTHVPQRHPPRPQGRPVNALPHHAQINMDGQPEEDSRARGRGRGPCLCTARAQGSSHKKLATDLEYDAQSDTERNDAGRVYYEENEPQIVMGSYMFEPEYEVDEQVVSRA
ncbi:hypothetical protein GWK47_004947 [Chionoecetes opilio]|uniref:Uncharacterized protein n=1 Tax=Chionoecetes opilio TaxID=41210 RepID=A0A8J4YDU1_CHIOP|nr:hypothetical protein GWK47_004947 [Chionoecetes opilio]